MCVLLNLILSQSIKTGKGTWQTCQPVIKENLEIHGTNQEILQKVVRFFFFLVKIKRTLFPLGELTVNLNISLLWLGLSCNKLDAAFSLMTLRG